MKPWNKTLVTFQFHEVMQNNFVLKFNTNFLE